MAKSIIGFHYSIGGNKQGVGAFMEALNRAGIPFLMKGADDAGLCFEGQNTGRQHGVDNWLIYRVTTSGQQDDVTYDVPDYDKSPADAAREHWEKTVARWPPELDRDAVWMEPINEPRAKLSEADTQWQNMHPVDWLGRFMVEYAQIANGQGFKVCGPSFNAGEPEVFSTNDYLQPGMLDYLRYCAAHPEQAALAVHEYVWRRWKDGEVWSNWYPLLWGRVEAAMAAADANDIPRTFHIFVTEWGFAHRQAPHWPECEPYVTAYNEWAARWPQVKGVAAWTLQQGWEPVDDDVQTWLTPLAAYTLEREFEPGEQPARTHPLVGGTRGSGEAERDARGVDGAEPAGFTTTTNLGAVPAGSSFNGVWTFHNSGTTAWSGDYRLVYSGEPHPQTAHVSRSPMGEATTFTLSELGVSDNVAPGEDATVSVPLTAPAAAGTHATNWQLSAPGRQRFGPIRWLRAVVVPAAEGPRHDYTFVSFDNSAGDFTSVQTGRKFQAIWTVRNSGDAAWDGDFRLAHAPDAAAGSDGVLQSRLGAAAAQTVRDLTGQSSIPPGGSATLALDMVAPQQPGWYASHWQLQTATGEAIGRPLWMRIGVVGASVKPPRERTGRFQPGMNVNPDAHPLDLERLAGLDWTRFVYKAAAKHRNVDQAFAQQYRALIQAYAGADMKSLVILNQETEWGNAPWDQDGGDNPEAWLAYGAQLARAARRVAELCLPFGDEVAFQIWNEEDSPPTNPSAIGVRARHFAPVLGQVSAAIRDVAPEATVVIGGLNSGPDSAINYLQEVEAALGELPVDALAYHPYGRFVHSDPFYDRQFGTLQDVLNRFRGAFPRLPLWITEMGVAADVSIGPDRWEDVALVMRETFNEIADNHADHVPVLIWFAWTDLMRNAGITTVDGRMKEHVGEAFREMVARGQERDEPVSFSLTPQAEAEFLGFETTLANHNAVPAGSSFTNRWRFRNSGGTIWRDDTRLVFAPEDGRNLPLAEETSFDLSTVADRAPVAPGAETVVTLAMTAPAQPGRHVRSRWQLRDGQDRAFGHLYAEITTVPAGTAGSGAHTPDMTFVADQTVPDDTRFRGGEHFLKQWRVRNSGVRHWGSGFRLVFVEGDLHMAAGVASHMVPPAKPGDEVILSISMAAPPPQNGRPTTYESLWRIQDDHGNFFGPALWARIVAVPASTSTPLGRFGNPARWYSQLDPRWKEDQLGHGQQKMGGWGCLLTCYAMMLGAFGAPITPADLNRRLRGFGGQGFQGSDVQFAAPTRLLSGLSLGRNVRSWPTPEVPWTDWIGEDPLQRIDRALAEDHAVLAQVDRRPNDAYYHAGTEQHWVILVARTPARDDYLMLDPVVSPHLVQSQPLSLMRKYGRVVPSWSAEKNLRNAIKSALVYRFSGPVSGG